jgi:hypothetical protein
MEDIAVEIEQAVDTVNASVQDALRAVDLAKLPFVVLDSLEACDKIPRGISCLYFLRHTPSGLLYVGKAADLRGRWRAEGRAGGERKALHHLHARCIEVGGTVLSWFQLHQRAHEIAETVAIRVLHPPWNIRKRVPDLEYDERNVSDSDRDAPDVPPLYPDLVWPPDP